MAGVYKRKSDKARGKSGKFTGWYRDRHGKRKIFVAFTDKGLSLSKAQKMEQREAAYRDGFADPIEEQYRSAGLKLVAEHVADYRADLLAKGDKPIHARHVANAILRLLNGAAVFTVANLAPDRIQLVLGHMKQNRSARTINHAIKAVKAFARWLEESGRIARVPLGIRALRPLNQAADRRKVRRALDRDETARLLQAAESGPVRYRLTGLERAWLYRMALETGFRANELRSLTAASLSLVGDNPSITLEARDTKNGKRTVQPIRRVFAAELAGWMATRPALWTIVRVPRETARMLMADLMAAGIDARDKDGRIVDFHALRSTYITNLVKSGVNIKVVQKLARHSTITLTLDVYTMANDDDLRSGLEGAK
jgi:integrase